MTEILGFLTFVKQMWGLYQYYVTVKDEKWFQESTVTFTDLRNASTTDERKAALAKLAQLWAGA